MIFSICQCSFGEQIIETLAGTDLQRNLIQHPTQAELLLTPNHVTMHCLLDFENLRNWKFNSFSQQAIPGLHHQPSENGFPTNLPQHPSCTLWPLLNILPPVTITELILAPSLLKSFKLYALDSSLDSFFWVRQAQLAHLPLDSCIL